MNAYSVSRPVRLFQTALLACVLFLRFLVPNGWMPVVTASGWQLEICTGMEDASMVMDHGASMANMHHGSGKHDHHAGDRPCLYAAVAGAIAGIVTPTINPVILTPLPILIGLTSTTAIGQGLAAPPPPPTGPPAHS